ncbi:MAG: hypothetical protein ACJAR2_003807 [Ilumatobacter sp.]
MGTTDALMTTEDVEKEFASSRAPTED